MTFEPTANYSRVLNALARHQGREQGISGDKLAYELRISARALRKQISHAREQGVAVCGTPSSGYYIAATAGELQECCDFLRSRALHSLRLEALLRKVPLPHLLGQLQLLELDPVTV